MNIKQGLILIGATALFGVCAYLTATGQGVQPSEYAVVGIVAGILAASTLGLVWAFRD